MLLDLGIYDKIIILNHFLERGAERRTRENLQRNDNPYNQNSHSISSAKRKDMRLNTYKPVFGVCLNMTSRVVILISVE